MTAAVQSPFRAMRYHMCVCLSVCLSGQALVYVQDLCVERLVCLLTTGKSNFRQSKVR